MGVDKTIKGFARHIKKIVHPGYDSSFRNSEKLLLLKSFEKASFQLSAQIK